LIKDLFALLIINLKTAVHSKPWEGCGRDEIFVPRAPNKLHYLVFLPLPDFLLRVHIPNLDIARKIAESAQS
jgi:hypothetical protein